MSDYRHTQRGTVITRSLIAGATGTIVIGLTAARDQPAAALTCIAVAATLLACAYLFGSLTVEVSPQWIALRFGPGLIRKRFAVAEITGAQIVRNRWYYGWGIKLTPHGWLYNVSGLDAVEIVLRGGRKCRIGTDEPQQLLEAISKSARQFGHDSDCHSGLDS